MEMQWKSYWRRGIYKSMDKLFTNKMRNHLRIKREVNYQAMNLQSYDFFLDNQSLKNLAVFSTLETHQPIRTQGYTSLQEYNPTPVHNNTRLQDYINPKITPKCWMEQKL